MLSMSTGKRPKHNCYVHYSYIESIKKVKILYNKLKHKSAKSFTKETTTKKRLKIHPQIPNMKFQNADTRKNNKMVKAGRELLNLIFHLIKKKNLDITWSLQKPKDKEWIPFPEIKTNIKRD